MRRAHAAQILGVGEKSQIQALDAPNRATRSQLRGREPTSLFDQLGS